MDGRYRVHYLPPSLSYAVDNKPISNYALWTVPHLDTLGRQSRCLM